MLTSTAQSRHCFGALVRVRGKGSRLALGSKGVTLIELMVVLAILAIVASIAVANYTSYLTRTKRTDAKTALLQVQVAEEKYFLQKNTYGDGTAAQLNVTSPTPGGNYTIIIGFGTSGTLLTSYLATATTAGSQVGDTACPTLTINEQGTQGPPAAVTAGCWK